MFEEIAWVGSENYVTNNIISKRPGLEDLLNSIVGPIGSDQLKHVCYKH